MRWDDDDDDNTYSEPAEAHDSEAAVEEERADERGGELTDADRPEGRVDRNFVEPGPYHTPPPGSHGPTLIRDDDPR